MATGYEDLIPAKDVSEKKSNDYSNLNSRDDYSDLIPSQTYAEEKPRKSIIDQGLAVAKESLVGGISGAFAPEVIQKTGQAIKTGGRALGPYGRIPTAVGSAIEAGGVAMKASRPASFAAGTIGGAGGETAGQVVESKYGPGIGAETARLLGATLTPLPFEFLGTRAGGLVGTLAGKFGVPGMSTAKTVGQLLEEQNIKPQSLTAEQRAFIAKKIEEIRGGKSSIDAEKDIINALKTGAEKITQQASMTADQLEAAARSQSESILSEAQQTAKRIRDSARALSPAQRQISEADAQSVLQKGQQEAARIEKQFRDQIAEMRSKAGRLTTREAKGTQEARKSLAAVGTPQTPTETGRSIRDATTPIFENLKKVRSDNAEKFKGEAFGEALNKERAGQRVSDTQAFKNALESIANAIKNPETGLRNVSINEVESQLLKVKRALEPTKEVDGAVVGQPVSFQGLENLRRFLRDRAYGLPAEGFDAIGQKQAGELANAVEAIQTQFSPKITKFLEQYKIDSEPLNRFKTKLGEAIVGKEEFDMARFATDPAELASKVFKSETSVKDLMQLLGGDARSAEQFARSFVASKLQDASGKDIQKFVTSNADWLNQFPQLRQQLEAAATTIGRSEGFGTARTTLADTLRTGATNIADVIPSKTGAVLSAAEKEAQQAAQERIKGAAKGLKGEKKLAAGVVKRAETEAADVTKAAGAEAGKIRADAQARADTILAGTTDADRVRQIILGTDDAAWKEASQIILSYSDGKERLADAVNQILASKAERSLKGAIDDWKYIGQRLIDNGLMDSNKVAETAARLQEIFVAPVDLRRKLTIAEKLLRNAVVGYAAPAAVGAGTSAVGLGD
jgi:cell division septum initiation protein DivIVA